MTDFTQSQLESSRPSSPIDEGVGVCLKRLYEDRSHSVTDEVVTGLTYEELIGVLLLARDSSLNF
jgi:hypothetical protein